MLDPLNLLEQPLFQIEDPAGQRDHCSLPEVLARIGTGAIADFPGLRPHQRHAWHAFLVQVAGLCHLQDPTIASRGPEAWHEALLSLTDGRSEPWCLVVEDLLQPAFLQPPVPEGSLASFGEPNEFPDDLDMLVTAKNHDVKRSRMANPRPEHWIFSLLTLQTMAGFSGRDNYGIARMNGGQSNRPAVGTLPGLGLAEAFEHDVRALLQSRQEVAPRYRYRESGGLGLLWLVPWDGDTSLALGDCDPFFIEVCPLCQ